jgi:hypothetical protein
LFAVEFGNANWAPLVDLRVQALAWLLEMPAMPSAVTISSTDRAEMPCTEGIAARAAPMIYAVTNGDIKTR